MLYDHSDQRGSPPCEDRVLDGPASGGKGSTGRNTVELIVVYVPCVPKSETRMQCAMRCFDIEDMVGVLNEL